MTAYRVKWLPNWIPFWKRAFVFWFPFTSHPWMVIPAGRKSDPQRLERTKAHEVVHVDQWTELGRWRFLRRYFGSVDGKMDLEAEAFAASCAWWLNRGHQHVDSGGKLIPVIHFYSTQLHDHYGLDKTREECRAAIEGYLT